VSASILSHAKDLPNICSLSRLACTVLAGRASVGELAPRRLEQTMESSDERVLQEVVKGTPSPDHREGDIGGSPSVRRMMCAYIGTPRPTTGDQAFATQKDANRMILAVTTIAGLYMTTVSNAKMMQCDEARRCHLVRHFPSNSVRTNNLCPTIGETVGHVRVEAVGDDSLLCTAQRIDRSGTLHTRDPLDSFIRLNDYPSRLSPVEHGSERVAFHLTSPIVGSVGTGTV